ncbi:hypothetical protein NPIL_108141 [Nephila pilipes]|uniref:Uncharacterized protein n=1 Tax=Nephila pilipes TaxID=299642 RepID=A0A8X6T6E8_NEPPI|nr:hypothetical protein NPIL_108141 [Nephila pilipes]
MSESPLRPDLMLSRVGQAYFKLPTRKGPPWIMAGVSSQKKYVHKKKPPMAPSCTVVCPQPPKIAVRPQKAHWGISARAGRLQALHIHKEETGLDIVLFGRALLTPLFRSHVFSISVCIVVYRIRKQFSSLLFLSLGLSHHLPLSDLDRL